MEARKEVVLNIGMQVYITKNAAVSNTLTFPKFYFFKQRTLTPPKTCLLKMT